MNIFSYRKDVKETNTVDSNLLKETEDYVLISTKETDGYYVINKHTKCLEHEESKLPTALYQVDSMQASLDKYRKEHPEN